ncbi:MAG: leucine-rich repeat protein [Muribaculaceae bacterium]|nr:leucine-rich repeat protein [Muribaculaceae bacterium]
MKRLAVSITLLICFVTALMAANGSAGKGIKWELKKGVLTISGNGPMKNFGKDRPWYHPDVKKLVVEEGVTSIGDNLCYGSKNLKEVELPNTLESIGNSAFQSCDDLTYISLPSSLKSIGKNAFQGCQNLSDIHIPYGVEDISDRAFYNCTSLIELDLPISLKRIGNETFAKCSNLVTARLAQGLESVGDKAFDECRILANLSGLPEFINTDTFNKYSLNRAAVKNYWDRKEEMAAKYGNASGTNVANKSEYAKVEPSDVDTDIPFTGKDNKNTFALIIANENYGKLANVPFAINDGEAFARYCHRTLGIPEKNVLLYKDASYGSMREAFGDLRLINDFAGDDMKVIVYYAGHGAPDDATLDPYLIPVDAGRINKDVCIPLASIYQELGSMKLQSAIVFLDACFSGGTRENKMVMADARAIARVPKKQGLTGKVAVLSATSDEQTALPYHDKGHGMFTYYLLKRLQETKGNVTLSDLKEYITKEVSRNSSIVNRKEQTPTFTVSNGASAEWDSWKLTE